MLGARVGENYIVRSGLKEGDRVVIKGNFKIDSAMQIQAKPSMMNPGEYYSDSDNVFTYGDSISSESASILTIALPYYLATSQALSEDNPLIAADFFVKFKDEIEKFLWGIL